MRFVRFWLVDFKSFFTLQVGEKLTIKLVKTVNKIVGENNTEEF